MTGEVERLKVEEAQAAQDKKKAAEALMDEVHRSNAEQVFLPTLAFQFIWHAGLSCLLLFLASGSPLNSPVTTLGSQADRISFFC